MMRQYFGKYRGTVTNNVDPQQQGRVQINVPAVLGDGRLSWAMPCAPFAGPQVGFFAIPPNGANVWVEFEGGDPDYPIWTGCFWGDGEAPVQPAPPTMKVFRTAVGTIAFNELPGEAGVTIETPSRMKIVLDANGIEIADGQGASIKLARGTVSINGTALEVT